MGSGAAALSFLSLRSRKSGKTAKCITLVFRYLETDETDFQSTFMSSTCFPRLSVREKSGMGSPMEMGCNLTLFSGPRLRSQTRIRNRDLFSALSAEYPG